MPLANFGFLLPEYVRSDVGFQVSLAPVNPAPGAQFSHKVPGDFFEVPLSLSFVVTTNATVASRDVRVSVQDGDGKTVATIPVAALQTASTAAQYNFSLAATNILSTGGGSQQSIIFPMVMQSGYRLVTTIVNWQAGDQISTIGLVLQQYETGLLEIPTTRRAGVAEGVIGAVSVGGSGELVSVVPSLSVSPVPSAPAPAPTAPAPAPSPPAPAGTQYPLYTAPAPAPAVYIPLPSAPTPVYIPIPSELSSAPTPTPTLEPQ